MAWPATDSFGGYADGNNLDTLNGGSGWAAAWSETTAGTFKITNVQAQGGTLSVRAVDPGADKFGSRTVATHTSGIVTFAMRVSTKTSTAFSVILDDTGGGATRVCTVQMNASNIVLIGSSTVTILSNYSVDTWYVIHLYYDVSANDIRARLSTQNYWAAITGEQEASDEVTRFRFGNDQGSTWTGTMYLDEIAPGSAPTATTTSTSTTSSTSTTTSTTSSTTSTSSTSSTTSSTTSTSSTSTTTSSTSTTTSSTSSSSTTTQFGYPVLIPEMEINDIKPILEIKGSV